MAISQSISNGLGNVLAPNKHQDIALTKAVYYHLCIITTLSLQCLLCLQAHGNELNIRLSIPPTL